MTSNDLKDVHRMILCTLYRIHGRKRKGVKHVPKDRIKQLIPHSFHKEFNDGLRELQNRGLIRRVKSKTYALTKYGFALAYKLIEEGTCDTVRQLYK